MRSLAGELPNDLLQGYRAGLDLKLAPRLADRPIYAVGMGASAIAADLARGVVEAETEASLVVVRGADLPRAVGPRSCVLVLSYSGETTEALEAYDLAGRRGAQRTVVTAGGRLAEKAAEDEVPVLRIPGGQPPRSAIGHLFGGFVGLLDALFPESNERRLEIACDEVQAEIPRLASSRGPAAGIADRVGDRLPFVLAERSFAPLARRWASQLEENAKRLAVFDELTEAIHNSLIGWDTVPRPEAARYALVLVEWAAEHPLVRAAVRHLRQVARARGVRTVSAPLPFEDRLAALAHGLALGDFVSLELARRRGVDPYPIPAIARGRAALAAPRPAR